MSEESQAHVASTDDLLIDTLRACGFIVRTNALLAGERPQIVGTLDNPIAFFKLAVTGADAGAAIAFAPYLKEGETPLQRLQREMQDSETLAGMLADERTKSISAPAPVTHYPQSLTDDPREVLSMPEAFQALKNNV